MSKKLFQFLILIAILAIPVIIFLFLKSYGNNQFDIPYYHTEAGSYNFDCDFPQDTFRVSLTEKNDKKANVTLFFKDSRPFGVNDLTNTQSRLKSLFKDDFSFTAYGNNDSLDSAAFKKLMNCGFVTDTVNQFILHDAKGRIRGYYNTDLEELDRLIVETKILLENE